MSKGQHLAHRPEIDILSDGFVALPDPGSSPPVLVGRVWGVVWSCDVCAVIEGGGKMLKGE